MAFFNIFSRYQKLLIKRPFLTNAVSTALIFSSGDALAQLIFPEQQISTQKLNDDDDKNKTNSDPNTALSLLSGSASSASKLPSYDYARTLRAAIYGGIIFAPIGDSWYKILSKLRFPLKLPANRKPALRNGLDTFTRVCVDQLFFAPLGIPLYFSVMSLLENKSFDQLKHNLQENYKVTLLTNWMVWPLFQFANFSLIPVEFRLLSVNVISIFWNCFLSYRNDRFSKAELPVYSPPAPE